ncbi:hypothetical protein DL96DRAFT_183612 [Flagelloscypha sp. PMI_526]|nr:hypothetical protein DL96DRAFT_183612 [Flagelloscypha sp. PMI_526]
MNSEPQCSRCGKTARQQGRWLLLCDICDKDFCPGCHNPPIPSQKIEEIIRNLKMSAKPCFNEDGRRVQDWKCSSCHPLAYREPRLDREVISLVDSDSDDSDIVMLPPPKPSPMKPPQKRRVSPPPQTAPTKRVLLSPSSSSSTSLEYTTDAPTWSLRPSTISLPPTPTPDREDTTPLPDSSVTLRDPLTAGNLRRLQSASVAPTTSDSIRATPGDWRTSTWPDWLTTALERKAAKAEQPKFVSRIPVLAWETLWAQRELALPEDQGSRKQFIQLPI